MNILQKIIQKKRMLAICMSIFGTNSSLLAVPMTFTVSVLTDTPPLGLPGELRTAILASNANNPGVGPCAPCNGPSTPNHNIIDFTVAGVITPVTNLPTITRPVLIDGYSAPGASANTNPINAPNNAVITVEINGPGPVFNPAAPQYGLRLGTGSSGSTIQGLALTNWAAVLGVNLSLQLPINGVGIRIDSNNNFVLGCFLGMNLADASAPNFNAVRTLGDSNTIGDGTEFGRNLISGQFGGFGTIQDNGTNTLLEGNTIGLNRAGNAALMRDARLGVSSAGAIGTQLINNIIAGHSAVNVVFESNGSPFTNNIGANLLVQGNFIGTDITGSFAVQPNGLGFFAISNVINGEPNGIVIQNNVISGNSYGIVIGENNFSFYPVVGTILQSNIVGLDATGSFPIPNQLDGIWVKSGRSTYFNDNTISGNGRYGIRLCKSQMSNIKGNWIGTNINGAELGNGSDGIYIGGPGVGVMSYGDIIGGAKLLTTIGFLGENNIIMFNGGNGIKTVGYVQGATIDGNTITNNGANGIFLGKNASQNVIGSFKSTGSLRIMGEIVSQGNGANPASALGSGNTIGNNAGDGIRLHNANDNVIQGNLIGTDGFGTPMPNAGVGVRLMDSSENLIGALDAANTAILPPFLNIPNPLGNIIDDNDSFGVSVEQVTGNAVDNSILSNQIVNNNGNGIQFVG